MASSRGNARAIKQLQQIAQQIKASPKVLIKVHQDASKDWLKLVEQGFNEQRNPYGNKWARKKRPNGYKILHSKRNRLKGSIRVIRVSHRGFTLNTRVPYGKYHQSGTAIMPARIFMPVGNRTIPKKYQDAIVLRFRQHMRKHFRK